MNRLFASLVMFCYAVPALLGHGGLHALYGVEHHCCGLPVAVVNATDGHTHTGCSHGHHHAGHHHHHGRQTSEDSPSSAPVVPLDHSEDNCSLCQHVAQGQLETTSAELICSGTVVQFQAIAPTLYELADVITPHAPRGPPVC